MWRARRRPQSDDAAIHAQRRELPTLTPDQRRDLPQLLRTLGEGLLALGDSQQDLDEAETTPRLAIDAFLRAHAHEAIRLADLATALHRSPSRTSHLVRECYHCSFTELLRRERILRARSLLLATDESIARIGARVGIPDPAQFSKTFTAVIGCSPRAFRARPRIDSLRGR